MGDARYRPFYDQIVRAKDPLVEILGLSDDGVVQALAAAARENDPLLANILATEAMNRMRRARTALAHVAECVVSVDTRGRVNYVNPAMQRILGWAPAEILDKDFREVVETEPVVQAVLDVGEVTKIETRFRRKDGGALHVRGSVAPKLRESVVEGVVVAFRDATDEIRAAEERERMLELMAQRAVELNAVVQSIRDPILIGDADGLKIANAAALEMMGATDIADFNARRGPLEEALRMCDLDDRPLPPGRSPYERALRGEAVTEDVKLCHAKDRSDRVYRQAAAPVVVDGRVIAVVLVATDVTRARG